LGFHIEERSETGEFIPSDHHRANLTRKNGFTPLQKWLEQIKVFSGKI